MSVLARALSEAMQSAGTDLVVLDDDYVSWVRHPWQEVHYRAENVADRVVADGATAVGLVGDPTVEFISAIPGVMYAGAAASILPGPVRGADPDHWARSTIDRFRSTGVRAVFSHGAHLARLRDVAGAIVVHDVADVAHAQRSSTFQLPGRDADVAVLQGTAGSTGTPRTARISPEAALANMRGLIARTGVHERDRGQTWLPLYHDMGLLILLTCALTRLELWHAPTQAFAASPFGWLKWITKSQATLIAAPNMAYNLIGRYSKRVSDVDLGHVRFALNGGEPVDSEGCTRFAAEMARFGFDPAALSPSYGLAESTCAVTVPATGVGMRTDEITVTTDGSPTTRTHALLGTAIAGMEVRLGDGLVDGVAVTGRDVGQIEIRGTSMMTGYVGETPIDRQAWFPTGDIGYFVDGELVVCGRSKELITVAGRNIFPSEIERVAAQVKGVREGAVVAVGTGGTAARHGLVIAAEFRGPDEPGARSELVRRVASECGVVPADVVFLKPGSLPRTSSGKLRRLEVKRNLEGAGR